MSFTSKTENKITTDSVQYAVTDDNTGVGTGEGFFDVILRGGGAKSHSNRNYNIICKNRSRAICLETLFLDTTKWKQNCCSKY